MVAMLERALQDLKPEHAACVFDAKGDTFRNAWYAEYKAQRAPMPEDLARQIEPIHEVVRLLGWPVLMVPGIEADDVPSARWRAWARKQWSRGGDLHRRQGPGAARQSST